MLLNAPLELPKPAELLDASKPPLLLFGIFTMKLVLLLRLLLRLLVLLVLLIGVPFQLPKPPKAFVVEGFVILLLLLLFMLLNPMFDELKELLNPFVRLLLLADRIPQLALILFIFPIGLPKVEVLLFRLLKLLLALLLMLLLLLLLLLMLLLLLILLLKALKLF